MQRNTITTLENLQVGDRFAFLKKDDVWQVTATLGNNKTQINKFTSDGKPILKYDEVKLSSMQVRFLRHTTQEVQ